MSAPPPWMVHVPVLSDWLPTSAGVPTSPQLHPSGQPPLAVGTGVLVGTTAVLVGGTTGVFVGGTGVLVGGTGVLVAEPLEEPPMVTVSKTPVLSAVPL